MTPWYGTFGLVFLACLAPVIPLHADALFPGQQYPAGTQPTDLALADLDGNGLIDAIVPNGPASTITVLPGSIDGGFSVGIGYPANGPLVLILADVDGNTFLDAVIVNATTATVGVLPGDGNGGFGPQTSYPVALGPTAVTTGTIDGGNTLDIVTADRSGDSISVLLGNGSGGFAASVSYPAGDGPEGVVLGDIDDNGTTDAVVALAGALESGFAVLRGNGDGSFQAPEPHPSGIQGGHTVALADIDEDGLVDVITGHQANSNNLAVALGQGGGAFDPPLVFSAADGVEDFAVLDLDADGHLDVVTANGAGRSVSILYGDGSGHLGEALTVAAGGGAVAVEVADLDADGLLDIVVANQGGGAVTVLGGTLSAEWPVTTRFASGGGATSGALGDFNGDTHLDLVTVNGDDAAGATDSFSIWSGNGAGALALGQTITTPPVSNTPALADVDGNGTLDVVTTHGARDFDTTDNDGADGLGIFFGNGSGGITGSTIYPADSAPQEALVADVNGDGVADVVTLNGEQFLVPFSPGSQSKRINRSVSVYRGAGGGALLGEQAFTVGGEPYRIDAANFNGDGAADLVMAMDRDVQSCAPGDPPPPCVNTGYPTAVAIVPGSATSVLAPAVLIEEFGLGLGGVLANGQSFPGQGDRVTAARPADWNGDGTDDIVFTQTDTFVDQGLPGLGVKLGNGSGGFGSSKVRLPVSGLSEVLDVNGDGLLDVVLGGGGVAVWLGTSAGALEPVYTDYVGNTVNRTLTGDLNHDGLVDVVQITRANEIELRIARRRERVEAVPEYPTPGRPEDIVLADYDNDGALDVITADGSYASVYRGTGGAYLYDRTDFAVAGAPLAVGVGDFNGDAALDIVTANVNGDSVTVQSSVTLGTPEFPYSDVERAAGDTPVALAVADLDDDDRADVVVANIGDDTVSVLLGSAEDILGEALHYDAGLAPQDLTLLDVTADGDLDAVVIGADSLRVLAGNGSGGFAAPVSYPVPFNASRITLAHFNADAYLDAVVANGGQTALLAGGAGGTFGPAQLLNVGGGRDLATADFDLDGNEDLLVVQIGLLLVLLGDGAGGFPSSASFSVFGAQSAAVADINGDGLPDIATGNRVRRSVSIVLNRGSDDSDGDGLADARENLGCTSAADADSDDDGLGDGQEDANGNGIVDPGETDPCDPDTDDDGIQDGTEQGETDGIPDPDGDGVLTGTAAGAFQPDADPFTTTDPLNPDSDGDGLSDGAEDVNFNGAVDAGESDPTVNEAALLQQVPAYGPLGAGLLAFALIATALYRRRPARHVVPWKGELS